MSVVTKVAIITGAARGIGRAIALRLANDGLNVVVNDLPKMRAELENVSSEIRSLKRQSLSVLGDASDESDVRSLILSAVKEFGTVDVMIANAGIALTQPLVKTPLEDWQRINKVNLQSTFLAYKYAAIQMIDQDKGGRIIGASSIAGKQGFAEWGAYAASKFAIRGLTQVSAAELQPHNITVNAYCPGPVKTHLWDDIASHRQSHGRGDIPVPDWKPTELDDVSGLVSFLVTDAAKNITGQSFNVNAGAFFD